MAQSMETLRAYLTPGAKKRRTNDTDEELSEMESVSKNDEEAGPDNEDKPPWWDQQQVIMVKEINDKLATIASMQHDLNHS